MSEPAVGSAFGVVRAPPTFANSQLNGSEFVVVRGDGAALVVIFLSGPRAGREWQLNRAHAVLFPEAPAP
jgi:hypothetical protein